jgi:hypothetical protein
MKLSGLARCKAAWGLNADQRCKTFICSGSEGSRFRAGGLDNRRERKWAMQLHDPRFVDRVKKKRSNGRASTRYQPKPGRTSLIFRGRMFRQPIVLLERWRA